MIRWLAPAPGEIAEFRPLQLRAIDRVSATMKTLLPAISLLLLILAAPSARAQGAAAFRQWKSTDGRTVEATFVALEGENVKMKGRNGALYTVPLARLSAEDQTWAKQQSAGPAPGSTPPAAPA